MEIRKKINRLKGKRAILELKSGSRFISSQVKGIDAEDESVAVFELVGFAVKQFPLAVQAEGMGNIAGFNFMSIEPKSYDCCFYVSEISDIIPS